MSTRFWYTCPVCGGGARGCLACGGTGRVPARVETAHASDNWREAGGWAGPDPWGDASEFARQGSSTEDHWEGPASMNPVRCGRSSMESWADTGVFEEHSREAWPRLFCCRAAGHEGYCQPILIVTVSAAYIDKFVPCSSSTAMVKV